MASLPGAAWEEERSESSMSSREEMLEKQRQRMLGRNRGPMGMIQASDARTRAPGGSIARRTSETAILSPSKSTQPPTSPTVADTSADLTKRLAEFGYPVEHNPDGGVRFEHTPTSTPAPSASATPLRQRASLGTIPLRSGPVDIEQFVTRPAPQGEVIQCVITRDKSGLDKMYPTYYLKMEVAGQKPVFLLAGRKRKRSKTSNYLISLDPTDMHRESDNFIAKLRANFVGTTFTIFDNGRNPADAPESEVPIRRELGAVTFETNVLGLKGPRKMVVLLPAIQETGLPVDIQPVVEADTLIERYKSSRLDGLLQLNNKPPTWNDETQSYVLNFGGRVTQASVKNFQIIHESDKDYIVMQFGRITDNEFTMDFRYPMSAVQAFAIALSSFDGKLAVE